MERTAFTKPRRFDFDLDLPPNKRWTDILESFSDSKTRIARAIDDELMELGFVRYVILFVAWIYTRIARFSHHAEITSISKAWSIPVHKVWIMQYLYEFSTACTSIVGKAGGHWTLFRTLDWDIDIMRELTIELRFVKNGRTLGVVTTWAGYVGVLTMLSGNGFALSVNYRQGGSRLFAGLRMMFRFWPIGYLLRDLLETNASVHGAKQALRHGCLISSSYVVLCDRHGAHALFERGPFDPQRLTERRDAWIIQTNLDAKHIDDLEVPDILDSRARLRFAHEILDNEIRFRNVGELVAALAKGPIVNKETVFLCTMVPEQGSLVSSVTRRVEMN